MIANRKLRMGWIGVLLLLLAGVCQTQAVDAQSSSEEDEWRRYQNHESGGGYTRHRRLHTDQSASSFQTQAKTNSSNSASNSNFNVPVWISQPTPSYQRPIEMILPGRNSTNPNDFSNNPGLFSYGYPPAWNSGLYGWNSRPFFNSYGAFSPAYRWSNAWNNVGYGGFFPHYSPAFAPVAPYLGTFGGFGGIYPPTLPLATGVPFGLPGTASFMFGSYGNPYGFGGFGSNRRTTSGNRVFQSAPSKASGNYYQPSTSDPSASGNYYASGNSQVVVPLSPSEPPPKDYWGPNGNPFNLP